MTYATKNDGKTTRRACAATLMAEQAAAKRTKAEKDTIDKAT
jgi:hypothetical protein